MKKIFLLSILLTLNFACVEANEDVPYTPSNDDNTNNNSPSVSLSERCRQCQTIAIFTDECFDLLTSDECNPDTTDDLDNTNDNQN